MQYIIKIATDGRVRPIPFDNGAISYSELEPYTGTKAPVFFPCGMADGLFTAASANERENRVNITASIITNQFTKIYGDACILRLKGDAATGFDFETADFLRKYIIAVSLYALEESGKK